MKKFFLFESEEPLAFEKLRRLRVSEYISQELINYIFSISETKEILETFVEDKAKLVSKVKDHFNMLFTHPFSSEFLEKTRKLGELHAKRRVIPSMFLGAFSIILSNMTTKLHEGMGEPECETFKPVLRVFTKLLCYDASLILDAYYNLMTNDLKESYRQIVSLNRIYQILREVNHLIFSERTSVRNLYREVCEILHRLGGFEFVWIGEPGENGKIRPVASSGKLDSSSDRILFTFFSLLRNSEELKKGKSLVINDISMTPDLKTVVGKLSRYGIKSAVALPIVSDSEAKAFLFLYSSEPLHFSEEEIQLLEEVSKDISVALMHIEKSNKLERMLFEDELTGLKNERYLIRILQQETEIAKKAGVNLALVRFDIDNFSLINHKYGHSTGDLLLKHISSKLHNLGEGVGTIARTGPDDFSVSFYFKKEEDIQSIILRIKEALSEPFKTDGKIVNFTVTIGVSVFPKDSDTPEGLVETAAIALKRAQKDAPEGIAFYSEKETYSILKSIELLERMEKALEREEFSLYYQPKYNLKTCEITGFEALLRWINPEKGLVPPGEFINILESSGLIRKVGYWVIKKAAEFLKKLNRENPRLSVAFNVSANQLKDPEFPDRVEKIIKEVNINPCNFQMELTERILLEEGERAFTVITILKKMGIKTSIDDFGTGFSSLLYLKRVPAESIKIDYSFVKGLPHNREDVEIVKATVSMAKNLGKRTIAEGVERQEQLEFLKELEVDEAQGFLFYEPVPDEKALLIAKGSKRKTKTCLD